jgi:hypothetical protein
VSCFSDEDINKDGEDEDKEGWEQVDVDEANEEMAKKKPLQHLAPCQARLLILHPKRHRPSPVSRRT